MAKHLARRGGVWWARLVVPERLRQAAGRREFIQSCQTHELHVAKLVSAILVADWRRQLLALESVAMSADVLKLIDKAPALTVGGYLSLDEAAGLIGVGRSQILRIATSYGLQLYCRLSNVPGFVLLRADLERDVADSLRCIVPFPSQMPESAVETTYSGVLPLPDSPQIASAIIADDLERIDLVLFDVPEAPGKVFAPDHAVWRDVGRLEVSASKIEAIRARLARDLTPEQIQRAQETRRFGVQSATVSGGQAGKSADKLFSQAVEAYCADANGLPKTLRSEAEQRQRKAAMLLFAEFMGDLPLCEIDAAKLRAFRDGPLRTLPGNANRLPNELKRATMPETIEALKADGRPWPTMSLEMQRERMLWLCRLFKWLHTNQQWIAADPSAPLEGETGMSKADQDEIRRRRKSQDDDDEEGVRIFAPDELKLIFVQPHYQTGNGAHITKGNARWYPFEYWLPLLGLYGGLRIKEASQLHLTDVRQESGVWCLDLNEKSPDKKLKNEQSWRLVPLAPVLVELGFLDYCNRLKAEGFRRVFPELTWAKTDAKYAKEPIRKMSAMLASLGMPRDHTRVFHNFRHVCNNALARVSMEALPYADADLRKFVRYSVIGHKPGGDVNMEFYLHRHMDESAALVAAVQYELPPIAKFDIDRGIEAVRAAISNKKGERRGREDMGPAWLETSDPSY